MPSLEIHAVSRETAYRTSVKIVTTSRVGSVQPVPPKCKPNNVARVLIHLKFCVIFENLVLFLKKMCYLSKF